MVDSFRLDYRDCRARLTARLAEPAPGRIQLVTGPRQAGKTTLLEELAERLGDVALYVAGDGPEAGAPGFWDLLWSKAEATARGQGRAVVLLDEAHFLPNWAARLKSEWDRLKRRKLPIHIVATGSSALRLATGSRESLAGRFERLTLTHWSASSIAEEFGLSSTEAVDLVLRLGSYPGALPLRGDPARWAAYVRDAIIEPAIGRDMVALAPIRKPALLRQVFGAALAAPAQIVSLQKLQGQLSDRGAIETVSHYLALLEEAFLVAPLAKYAPPRTRRLRAAPPKLVVLNNALLAAADPMAAPDPARDPARFGVWVENACLAHAWNAGQQVTYWREEPLEVDGVIDGSWGRWVVEIKTGGVTTADLRGLLEFVRRYPGYRPLFIGPAQGLSVARRAGIDAITWPEFLLSGTPGPRSAD